MQETNFKIAAADGQQLFFRMWQPETEPLAVTALVHGLGEHCGRYQHVARAFCAESIAMISFDLRGHGNTPGKRGYCPSFESLMDDIALLLGEAGRRFPGKAVFLYGHSGGGLLGLNFLIRHQASLAGVIASATGMRTPLLDQHLKVSLSMVLGSLLPSVTLATGLDPAMLSRDSEVVSAYRADPLVHGVLTLGMAKYLIQSVKYLDAHAEEIQLPLLIMHGAADQLVYPYGSQELADSIHSSSLKMWEGMYHEIHNEPGKESVIAFVIDWIMDRLK